MEGPCTKCTFPLNGEDHEKMFGVLVECTTSLMCAAMNGHEHCVNALIQSGADVNYWNGHGDTALMLAVRHGDKKCVDALIQSGADVNYRNRYGESALMLAATDCDVKYVDALIKAGASVNAAATDGSTALIKAAESGQIECVNFLMQQGADVNQRDYNGATALMHASNGECVDLLIQAGADVNARDNYGYTALFRDNLRYLKIGPVKRLLHGGAHTNVTENPVHMTGYMSGRVSLKTDERIVILLLVAGEKVERFRDEDIPEILKFKKERLQLKHMCRDRIRKHLIDLDAHANLFGRIAQLEIPSVLIEYLLYNMSLEVDANHDVGSYDDDDDDKSDDDDDDLLYNVSIEHDINTDNAC